MQNVMVPSPCRAAACCATLWLARVAALALPSVLLIRVRNRVWHDSACSTDVRWPWQKLRPLPQRPCPKTTPPANRNTLDTPTHAQRLVGESPGGAPCGDYAGAGAGPAAAGAGAWAPPECDAEVPASPGPLASKQLRPHEPGQPWAGGGGGGGGGTDQLLGQGGGARSAAFDGAGRQGRARGGSPQSRQEGGGAQGGAAAIHMPPMPSLGG